MLRYDACWPASTDDALSAFRNRGDSSNIYTERRTVKLVGISNPTIARWISFGWRVTSIYNKTKNQRVL